MRDTQCFPPISFCSACGGEIYTLDPIVCFEGRTLHAGCLPFTLQRCMPWEASMTYEHCDQCGQLVVPGDEICHPGSLTIHADCLIHWGEAQFPIYYASAAAFSAAIITDCHI